MTAEQAHGVGAGLGLSADFHIRLRVDDGRDAESHDRMVFHHQNSELECDAHDCKPMPSFSAAADLTGTSTNSSVPDPGALRILKFPPSRAVRSRIPTSPKCSPAS